MDGRKWGGAAVLCAWAVSLLSLSPRGAGGAVVPDIAWQVHTTDERPPDIAVAPGGDVYVASSTEFPNKAALTRYNASGGQVWRQVITASSSTRGHAVASDAAGNAYLAGEVYTSLDGPHLGNGDVFLRKYSPAGAMQWGRQFGTGEYDWPAGLAVAADGTSYVTSGGWATNYGVPPPGSLTTTRTSSATGVAGWVSGIQTFDGSYPGGSGSWSDGTALLPSGDGLYSMFTNYTRINNVIHHTTHLAKLTPYGGVQWTKALPLTNIFAAAVDSADRLYIAAGSLQRYDANGNVVWTATAPAASTFFQDVFIGPNDQVYACGRLTVLGTQVGFVAEYDSTGLLAWSKQVPLAGHNLDFYSLTRSGDQLVMAGLVVTGNTWSGNEIVALWVPEPAGLAGLAVAAVALPRRRRRIA